MTSWLPSWLGGTSSAATPVAAPIAATTDSAPPKTTDTSAVAAIPAPPPTSAATPGPTPTPAAPTAVAAPAGSAAPSLAPTPAAPRSQRLATEIMSTLKHMVGDEEGSLNQDFETVMQKLADGSDPSEKDQEMVARLLTNFMNKIAPGTAVAAPTGSAAPSAATPPTPAPAPTGSGTGSAEPHGAASSEIASSVTARVSDRAEPLVVSAVPRSASTTQVSNPEPPATSAAATAAAPAASSGDCAAGGVGVGVGAAALGVGADGKSGAMGPLKVGDPVWALWASNTTFYPAQLLAFGPVNGMSPSSLPCRIVFYDRIMCWVPLEWVRGARDAADLSVLKAKLEPTILWGPLKVGAAVRANCYAETPSLTPEWWAATIETAPLLAEAVEANKNKPLFTVRFPDGKVKRCSAVDIYPI